MSLRETLIGQKIFEWEVLGLASRRNYVICKCSCGTVREVNAFDIAKGKSKSCGHNNNRFRDLTGMEFGHWKVLEYSGNRLWKCQCQLCGTIKDVKGENLINGKTKSCGCGTPSSFDDLTGKTFGELHVIKYIGNGKYKCKCSCGKEPEVYGSNLRSGGTRSCGCKFYEHGAYTRIKNGTTNNREDELIKATKDRGSFADYIFNLTKDIGHTPNVTELMHYLKLSQSQVLYKIHTCKLENLVDLSGNKSAFEESIYNYIKTIYKGDIQRNKRELLSGNREKEIDIYLPDKNLGIECNGAYWHSEKYIDKNAHINKTMLALQSGIRLIHIFDFEWEDEIKCNKIKSYLNDTINGCRVIYARNTQARQIDNKEALEFCKLYHLQSGINSQINYGLYLNDELISVMTFDKPRFTNKYEYELLRLCTKSGITVVGGAEKLFKHFITDHKPKSIISYCDISKFTGSIYLRLGFKTNISMLSQPNYVWFGRDVISRYAAQKHKLLDIGLGEYGNTEVEIMHNLGYNRVYDCGNLKLIWECNK